MGKQREQLAANCGYKFEQNIQDWEESQKGCFNVKELCQRIRGSKELFMTGNGEKFRLTEDLVLQAKGSRYIKTVIQGKIAQV